MAKKLYYKVVRKSGERLLSVISSHWEVEYVFGEWTSPKMGRLFVFTNEECGHRFAYTNAMSVDLELWHCEVILPRKLGLRAACPEAYEVFWKQRSDVRKKHAWDAPEGTFTAARVKLVEHVDFFLAHNHTSY